MLGKTKKRKKHTNNMGTTKNIVLQDKCKDSMRTNDSYAFILFAAFVVAFFAGLIWPTTFSIASLIISLVITFVSLFFDEIILKKENIVFLRLALIGVTLGFFLAVLVASKGVHIIRDEPENCEINQIEDTAQNSSDKSNAFVDDNEDMGSIDISSISNDIDVLDPVTVISASKNASEKECFVPEDYWELYYVIDANILEQLPDHTAENKSQCEAIILDSLKNLIGTDSQPSDSTINGNAFFTNKTTEANEIENSGAGCTLADLKKIIALREEANMIFSTRDLQLLLSNDYHRLARVYKQQEMWQQAYENYLQSVSRRIEYLCLSKAINDNFYKSIYEIALLYQCIGDIPVIETESRSEAYFLSACLFEIASKWNYESEEERFGFYSSYYAGMINHKILLFALEDRDAQAGMYAVDAFAYYEKSLSFGDYRKQRSFQYLYLSQVCELSQQCLSYGFFSKGMYEWAEYGEFAQKYKEMSR